MEFFAFRRFCSEVGTVFLIQYICCVIFMKALLWFDIAACCMQHLEA